MENWSLISCELLLDIVYHFLIIRFSKCWKHRETQSEVGQTWSSILWILDVMSLWSLVWEADMLRFLIIQIWKRGYVYSWQSDSLNLAIFQNLTDGKIANTGPGLLCSISENVEII